MNEFSLRVKDAVILSFMLTASLQIGLLLALKTCLAPYDLVCAAMILMPYHRSLGLDLSEAAACKRGEMQMLNEAVSL